MHYLDNAATTSVHPQVVQTVAQVLEQHFANPSSLYAPGMESERIIDMARGTIASALGCQKNELIFTASGSEADNIAMLGAARARKKWGKHIVVTGFEHPAVLKTAEALAANEGFRLTVIAPTAEGTIDTSELLNAISSDTVLICAMHMNNEIGTLLDVATLATQAKQKNNRLAFHVDGVQAFTKLPFSLTSTQIDSYAVSAHKIHGPKGIGALYIRRGLHLQPVLFGGGQENGWRPGTENTAYIAGFAKAVELSKEHMAQNMAKIKDLHAQLLQGLSQMSNIVINSPQGGWPGICNISCKGFRSEVLLHFLEERGVYVSSGSACSKGASSHTLGAMRLPDELIEGALRISFDAHNTPQDIQAVLDGLLAGQQTLAH